MEEMKNVRQRAVEPEGESMVARPVAPALPFSLTSLAAVVALIGLGDAIYLIIHHLTGEQVPCSIVVGCEMVLTSEYATIAGIPLAAFALRTYASTCAA